MIDAAEQRPDGNAMGLNQYTNGGGGVPAEDRDRAPRPRGLAITAHVLDQPDAEVGDAFEITIRGGKVPESVLPCRRHVEGIEGTEPVVDNDIDAPLPRPKPEGQLKGLGESVNEGLELPDAEVHPASPHEEIRVPGLELVSVADIGWEAVWTCRESADRLR